MQPLSFQLLQQAKIPISAAAAFLFSQPSQRRPHSKHKQLWLLVIMIGLYVFQSSDCSGNSNSTINSNSNINSKRIGQISKDDTNLKGIAMVISGCILSSAAGIILEKLVISGYKSSIEISRDLAFWSLFIHCLSLTPLDVPSTAKEIIIVILGASGGILVGVCMRYSTTVERSISGAFSICIGALLKGWNDRGFNGGFGVISGVLMVGFGGVGYVLK